MAYLIKRKSLGWPDKGPEPKPDHPVFSVDLNGDRDVGTQLSGRDLLPAAPIDQSRKR